MAQGHNKALFGSILTTVGQVAGLPGFTDPANAPVTPPPAPAAPKANPMQMYLILGGVALIALLVLKQTGH